MASSMDSTYEEIQGAVVSIILGEEQTTYGSDQFASLEHSVIEVVARRRGIIGPNPALPDAATVKELVRDVFWDLFRQGFITPGLNSSNPNLPYFRISHFGKKSLASSRPFRFHDSSSYIKLVSGNVPDISDRTIEYLEEAVSTFYSGSLLASAVMLGVAAELEFLRVVDVAASLDVTKKEFTKIQEERFIRGKLQKFIPEVKRIEKSLDREATEDLETNFAAIQSILRISRNEAGHPSSAQPTRENTYVNLQLFVPFARQLMRLRTSLHSLDAGSKLGKG
jgi:hypothetical protein